MKRFIFSLTLIACTAALATGCCKKGSDDAEPKSEPGAEAKPATGGATLTGEQVIAKLKAGGYTPMNDPIVANVGGMTSTTIVTKPDAITVNIIEYADESIAKMAYTSAPSTDKMLSELVGRTVVRATCNSASKDNCEKVMSLIKG